MIKQPKKLKPCPFCGNTPTLILSGGYYQVVCTYEDCPGHLKGSLNQRDVIAAWNTRLKPKKVEPQESELENPFNDSRFGG